MSRSCRRALWTVALLAVAALGEAAAAGGAAADDIMGPLPPMDYAASPAAEGGGFPWRRAAAGALAVGFVTVAFYYLLRRRSRVRRLVAPHLAAWRTLAADAGSLAEGEFYERLLRIVRAGLYGEGSPSGAALTPRELACAPPSLLERPGEDEVWQGLCRRAEGAEYGRARVEPGRRDDDLALVRRLVHRARRRRSDLEADRGV